MIGHIPTSIGLYTNVLDQKDLGVENSLMKRIYIHTREEEEMEEKNEERERRKRVNNEERE